MRVRNSHMQPGSFARVFRYFVILVLLLRGAIIRSSASRRNNTVMYSRRNPLPKESAAIHFRLSWDPITRLSGSRVIIIAQPYE